MKKLSTISLFIFGVITTAILVAGLVFYQNKKDNQVTNNKNTVASQELINQVNSSGKTLVLDLDEINKHNKQSDCWLLIDSKVYNITSYFGSHPGGNSTMSATCGEDATAEYSTKNASATTSSGRSAHSSSAVSLLANYYIGDLNQVIGEQKITETSAIVAPASNGDDDEYQDD